ncbi:MAG: SDR family oxidoreductase [Bacteroidales bacterium]|nr:SDR family oxidoreductase [Bacteroidales bacterium]
MKKTTGEKLAIVTGGSVGIGYAIAEKFVKSGIFTVIVDRNEKNAKLACRQLGELSDFRIFELTRLNDLPDLVKEIFATYGRIDILVNNAGIHLKKPMLEVTDEEYQQVIMVNQTVVFALSREAGKIMVLQKNGSIINISSMASQYGLPQVIAYTAAKSAVEGMTRAMAVELSPFGVRVNCIAPGFIQTKMSAGALNSDPKRKEKVLSRTPLGYLGAPEDVGDAALFLASDAAKYITGIVLPVDGGNSIGF